MRVLSVEYQVRFLEGAQKEGLMSGSEYPKIYAPFTRFIDGPDKNRLNRRQWFMPEFPFLAGLDWLWTEKINGTNIRIIWDGHKVTWGGRTDNASIPAALINVLQGMFPEELMEQAFRDTPVVLYGEGFGAKVASGSGVYRPDPSFILFDVSIGGWWLRPSDVHKIAGDLGIATVPVKAVMPVGEAIGLVTAGVKSSFGDFWAEGLVGIIPEGIMTRAGKRIMMKIKHEDFFAEVK